MMVFVSSSVRIVRARGHAIGTSRRRTEVMYLLIAQAQVSRTQISIRPTLKVVYQCILKNETCRCFTFVWLFRLEVSSKDNKNEFKSFNLTIDELRVSNSLQDQRYKTLTAIKIKILRCRAFIRSVLSLCCNRQ